MKWHPMPSPFVGPKRADVTMGVPLRPHMLTQISQNAVMSSLADGAGHTFIHTVRVCFDQAALIEQGTYEPSYEGRVVGC